MSTNLFCLSSFCKHAMQPALNIEYLQSMHRSGNNCQKHYCGNAAPFTTFMFYQQKSFSRRQLNRPISMGLRLMGVATSCLVIKPQYLRCVRQFLSLAIGYNVLYCISSPFVLSRTGSNNLINGHLIVSVTAVVLEKRGAAMKTNLSPIPIPISVEQIKLCQSSVAKTTKERRFAL